MWAVPISANNMSSEELAYMYDTIQNKILAPMMMGWYTRPMAAAVAA